MGNSQPTIKEGYIQTDVGIIPDDWKVTEIGNLNPFVTSGSRGWAEFYSDRGSPFIRITNLSRDSIYLDLSDLKLVNIPPEINEGTRTRLYNDDLLISITADIGIIGYVNNSVPKPAYINQHIALVRFDAEKTDSRFVSYFLASENPQKLFRSSTDLGAKAGMSLLTVRKIKLALPPLPEQQAIAEVLSDVDALVTSLDQLIIKKRDIKQGMMQLLLTGKKRLTGFSGAWEMKTLGKIFVISSGTSKSSFIEDGGKYLIMDMGAVSSQGKLIATKQTNYEGDFLECGDLVMPKDDIGGGNIIGKVAFVNQNQRYILGDHVYKLHNHEGDSLFLSFLINSYPINSSLKKKVSGSAQLGLSKKSIEEQDIKIPPLREQQAIAQILSEMDAEIEALEKKREKYKAIRQGMMQELLIGKTRLPK
jgi:type I restriction enzyme S subunit